MPFLYCHAAAGRSKASSGSPGTASKAQHEAGCYKAGAGLHGSSVANETSHLHGARQQLEISNSHLQGGIFLQGICLAVCFTRLSCSSQQTYQKISDSCQELSTGICQVFAYYRISNNICSLSQTEAWRCCAAAGAQKVHLQVSPEPHGGSQGLKVQQEVHTHFLLNSFSTTITTWNCTPVQTKSCIGLFLLCHPVVFSGAHKHGLEETKGEQWYPPEELLSPAQLGAVAVEAHLYACMMWL